MTRDTSDHVATIVRPATFKFSGRDGRHQFERCQYPIVLSWAVTIHKVQLQGLSLDKSLISEVIFGIKVKPMLL